MLHHELGAKGFNVASLSEKDLASHIRSLLQTARVNGDVRDALQCLRFDGYQTGLLCREWHMGESSLCTAAQTRSRSEVKRHFNAIVESKSERRARTDPALYELAAARVGLRPCQLIYVDSREELLEPARQVGMTTVKCSTGSDGVRQVEALLELPLANFAWSRDVYAKVLWVANKDCEQASLDTK